MRGLERTYLTVRERKVLFSKNDKPQIFRLGMVPKENFLVYSTQFFNKTCTWKCGHGCH